MKKAQCDGCGADIIWIETVNGRRMPVDYRPVSGFVLMDTKFESDTPKGISGSVRVSHFATCPHANRFRKPAK